METQALAFYGETLEISVVTFVLVPWPLYQKVKELNIVEIDSNCRFSTSKPNIKYKEKYFISSQPRFVPQNKDSF